MSVQLIVYPQSYEGSFNAISGSSTEFIVNGVSFNNLNSTGFYLSTATNPYTDTLINAPASTVNTWYRFKKGSASYPSETSGSVVLLSSTGVNATGIYMKLSNLTVGQQYTIVINLDVTGSGTIVTQYANGTSIYAGGGGAASSSQITDTFTAVSTSDTVMIAYVNNVVNAISISSISVQPVSGTVTSGAIQLLGNGQTIVDLYEDEDLPLTLSVDDFKNVAEKVQSYSKAFNLPATKRNNKIFDNLFEITRSDDGVIFNVYKKTQCVLKQDGFILFEGYLRLLDVTEKEGEISYNVNLYSEVIALADFLKDSDFRALDFTELTHAYNKDNIKNSWNDSGTGITYTSPSTSGFRNAYSTVKYPFVDWNHLFIVADNPSGGTGPADGNPQLTSLEQAFRPWINVKYIIDRIFATTPFTYESTFFNTSDFEKLYMDFNWGANDSSQEPTEGTYSNLNYPISLSSSVWSNYQLETEDFNSNLNYDVINHRFESVNDNTQYDIDYNINYSGNQEVSFRWVHKDSLGVVISYIDEGTLSASTTSPFTSNFSGVIQVSLQSGETLYAEAKKGTVGSGDKYQTSNSSINGTIIASIGSGLVTTNTLLQNLRGETGQWEFLKGLITMFDLMTIPDKDNPNNIKIEPYPDVFGVDGDGIQLNWTDKIDTSEMKLTPLADLNRNTIFKFVEDDEDWAFTNYKNQVGGHLYGSKKFDAGNEFNILEGLNEVIAEPFAATVVKPLMSQYPQFTVPSLYAYNPKDDTTEGFDNSPRIMYNNGVKSTGASYYIPAQNGLSSENQTNYLQFSHIKDGGLSVSDYKDFHFGECQLLAGANTPNNLFNLYWLPYYAELYNPNTRIMTIKVNLSPADISEFKFNDTIFIKNRIFRCNKIDYKPNDLATVEFILIP